MTTEQIQDTLNKIKADSKQLDWELEAAKRNNDRCWLENQRTWNGQLLAKINEAIAECDTEIAAIQ